ncbi:peptidase M23 [Fictibacillus macauensis ZFHKF-1]|uniref:Peptidase M23 n=1 Tax=Fictibacillus macauensis ZFHKF-1 TaxID=1196324 RepID=I8UA97_9BACL|nr:M23 family metallopeptidase [Fictibacillus macauensis]EIT83875.1 peptidase M23 [Fictibacillus macauensis ZFHKF-1]
MKDEEKQPKKTVPLKGRKMGKFMKRRWVYPAVYLGFAAIVLISVLWYQNESAKPKTAPNTPYEKQEAVPASMTKEVFKMPAKDVVIKKQFYNAEASAKEKEAALVFYNNIYYQNKGIDIGTESGNSFDVTAAMSGNVVKAAKDPELGFVVEVKHSNGVITHYSSLASIKVKEGDRIKQGDMVGTAGKNSYDKDAKVHAHFEIRKDGMEIDPVSAWEQSTAQIQKLADSMKKDEKKQNEATSTTEKSQKNRSDNATEKDTEKESSSTSENKTNDN